MYTGKPNTSWKSRGVNISLVGFRVVEQVGHRALYHNDFLWEKPGKKELIKKLYMGTVSEEIGICFPQWNNH